MKWSEIQPGAAVYDGLYTNRGKGIVERIVFIDALTAMFEKGTTRRVRVKFEGLAEAVDVRLVMLRKTPNRKKIREMVAMYRKRGVEAENMVLPLTRMRKPINQFPPSFEEPPMSTIEATNIGRVPRVSIPVPAEGGVVVLRGPQDCGKSTLIEATGRLLGNQQAKITCREGAQKGVLEGLGVRVSVVKVPRRTGVLEAIAIDGRLTIADLVDPKLKDPVAADARRIRALLTLNGVAADPAKFHNLLPDGAEQFASIVGPVEGSDLVELADVIKRRLEAAAREAERRADDFAKQADACRIACEDVDTAVETDGEKLQAAFEGAVARFATLKKGAEMAEHVLGEAKRASRAMADAKAGYVGPIAADAQEASQESQAVYRECQKEVESAEASLALAKRNLHDSEQAGVAAEKAWRAAEDHETMASGWQETIDAATGCETPSAVDLADAENAKTEARQAIEAGRLAREAKAKQGQADGHQGEAGIHAQAAESLRDAARATDGVLSAAVNSDALTVVDGRLMTRDGDRGLVPFHERSQGIRCKLAIDEAAKLIRRHGAEGVAIIPLPQELWEGLQPANKLAVDQHAKKHRVTIITAEANDDELRAEAFADE